MIGMLAGSKAGHDKGIIYVIINEDTEYVYLVDGETRKLLKPKKKNKKHIQIIKKCPEAGFVERIKAGLADDIEIRKLIKRYKADR
ncbi:MAG: RNA-binding protein [Lachnospiraceae bacterium]|nr:RNA-binding protein [Lachnospiraceae bacterium]